MTTPAKNGPHPFSRFAEIVTVLGFVLGSAMAIVPDAGVIRAAGIWAVAAALAAALHLFRPRLRGLRWAGGVLVVGAMATAATVLLPWDQGDVPESESDPDPAAAALADDDTDDQAGDVLPMRPGCQAVPDMTLIYESVGRAPQIVLESPVSFDSFTGRDPNVADQYIVSTNGDRTAIEVRPVTDLEKRRTQSVEGTVSEPAISGDGETVVAVQETAEGTRLISWDLAVGTVEVLHDPAEEVSSPSLSFNADRIAWAQGNDVNRTVRIAQLASGSVVEIRRLEGDMPSLSANGDVVAYSSRFGDNRAIYRASVDRGEPIRLTDPGNAADSDPAWVPECDHVVFVRHLDGSTEIRMAATVETDELIKSSPQFQSHPALAMP